jgi:hypothetical protein
VADELLATWIRAPPGINSGILPELLLRDEAVRMVAFSGDVVGGGDCRAFSKMTASISVVRGGEWDVDIIAAAATAV